MKILSDIKKGEWIPLQILNQKRKTALDWIDQHQKLVWVITAIVFRFCLDLMYVYAASPSYAYAGLVLAPNFLKYTISVALYAIIFALLPKREGDAVAFLLHLLYNFYVSKKRKE